MRHLNTWRRHASHRPPARGCNAEEDSNSRSTAQRVLQKLGTDDGQEGSSNEAPEHVAAPGKAQAASARHRPYLASAPAVRLAADRQGNSRNQLPDDALIGACKEALEMRRCCSVNFLSHSVYAGT
jgi:hypothetical protein